MIILGIETSCDDTAVALLEVKKKSNTLILNPLVNLVVSQIKIHQPYGGIVPELANREHLKNLPLIFEQAIEEVRKKREINSSTIDLIAVTQGPGLLPSLLIGVNFARALAWFWNKPIIGVNHLQGHLLSFLLPSVGEKKNINFSSLSKYLPALGLLVSGGHTFLVLIKNFQKLKILGETRDDAAGECFDKGARLLGLGYPGGPAISTVAIPPPPEIQTKIHLPRPMLNSVNYDFSFSGLKTALFYKLRQLEKREQKKFLPYLAYELQEAITDVLVKKTLQAAEEYQAKAIILGGGVTANKRLRQKLSQQISLKYKEKYKDKVFFPLLEYTGDNALMIALAGYWKYYCTPRSSKKNFSWQNIDAEANLKLA